MFKLAILVFSTALITGIGIVPAMAGIQELLAQSKPWKRIDLTNKRPTQFRIARANLDVMADKSVAFLYRELNPVMTRRPRMEWQWRVTKNIPATDLAKARADDRPVAVHLWFDDTVGNSLFGSVASLLGRPRVGHLLTYVWGGKRPPGTILRNPYYPKKGAIIILRNSNARTNGWQAENRDIVADFRKSFGKAPDLTTLRYVSVSGDTDDTKTLSKSQIRALRIVE